MQILSNKKMIVILNKIVKSEAGESIINGTKFILEEEEIKYSDLILMIIKETPQGGYDYAALEHSLSIRSAIRNMNEADGIEEVIKIETADFKYLQKRIEEKKWVYLQQYILDFRKYINSLL